MKNPKTPTLPAIATQEVVRSRGVRELLDLRWSHAVHAPKAERAAEHGTDVAPVRAALPLEEALALLAKDDPRPLLVLRECAVCNETDDALLSRTGGNERTLILARWFHCVKLPVDVVEKDHPFNALFPDDESEHLFVSSRDGTARLPLESDTSRVELWTAMERTLVKSYAFDPVKSVKQVVAGLDRIDVLERRAEELESARDHLLEKTPVDQAKVVKLSDDAAAARREGAEARAALQKLFDVPPRASDGQAAR